MGWCGLASIWMPSADPHSGRAWRGTAWRAVEAQHRASTLRLVDSPAEQDLLETLLETSKPSVPAAAGHLHYLLATPFRYPPRAHGSRFRGLADPGVWYGAREAVTAMAESGYWRWRFARAAQIEIPASPQTVFASEIAGAAVDLRRTHLALDAARWGDPNDYSATQALARSVRAAGGGIIINRSVRDPAQRATLSVLTPSAFARRAPRRIETWQLTVRRSGVVWQRADVLRALTHAFDFAELWPA